ncbi:MAG: molybdopterin molybdotransferase MoeA [Gammaproteobacteria bacterium]|nr:molybdopterin molybdotransferase MoeA [Gammaproteobacteria bacterium]MDH5799364.1 molybdopterin molybdotransferase MoeA [Gammaproteobacteria bacterium]
MSTKQPVPTNPSCMDEHDPNSLSVKHALEKIRSQVEPVPTWEKLALRDGLNRVVYDPIHSPMEVPPYTNSAMDGYAVRADDLISEPASDAAIDLQVVATVMAGSPYSGEIQRGQCARIMTGGKMPPGTDTVIMQEHVQRSDDRIRFNPCHQPGQNVRHAGEDIAKDSVVLQRGQSIGPAELGLLASLGINEFRVFRRVRVTFFSTGNELQSVGTPLQEGQIYDSNRYTLYGMLKRCGAEILDLGTIPDNQAATEKALLQAATQSDVIITSGGVSVGDADFVKQALDKLGVVNFWRIAMKPGKPLAFGRINECLFFGLPGNPVSTMVTFYQFVLPTLNTLSGKPQTEAIALELPCSTAIKKVPGRMEFQRGIMEHSRNGQLQVRVCGEQGSGILSSMSKANCFIILPESCDGLEAGSTVQVQPFNQLLIA